MDGKTRAVWRKVRFCGWRSWIGEKNARVSCLLGTAARGFSLTLWWQACCKGAVMKFFPMLSALVLAMFLAACDAPAPAQKESAGESNPTPGEVVEKVEKTVDSMKEDGKSTAKEVEEAAEAVVEKAKDVAVEGADQVKEGAETAADAVKEGAEKAGDVTKEAVEKIQSTGGSVVEEVSKVVDQAKETIRASSESELHGDSTEK